VKYLPDEVEEDVIEANAISRAWKKIDANDPFLDVFVDWAPMVFWLKVLNKAPSPIGPFEIAFDKNWAGITSAQPVDFPPEIEFGESFEIEIPMVYNDRFYRPGDAGPLRVALRVGAEAKMFAVPIEGSAVLLEMDRLTDVALKEAWTLHTSEFQMEVPGGLPSDQVYASRNIRVMNRTGPAVTVSFSLAPSNIYICKVQEVDKKLLVVVHGNLQLFDIIRASAESIFSI
jgi:hypothetical protein